MRRIYARRPGLLSLLPLLLLATAACVPLAGYDQRAYENATTLKARTLALYDKSLKEESYAGNADAVDRLLVDLSAAYEYANGVEYNNEAASNWDDLIGDEDGMIKGWLSLWEDAGQISPIFAEENRRQIEEGFDTIICLEANKRQLTACTSLKRADRIAE